ncbi:Dolichyl-phosphate-mannose-protein mannosyltransferase [uncultured archaeon]|nr:Dolichyl-phosphate-mannose-protein mannosyltransferase [uncultured archaeon]
MGETLFERTIRFIESNRISLLVFFCSFFLFVSFGGTRLFISDEGLTINQFYNLVHGSLAITMAKIGVSKGMYFVINKSLYVKFSYALPILSMPAYYLLRSIDQLYGAHLFLLQLWAMSAGVIVYLIARTRSMKYALFSGITTYIVLISVNLLFFKPISFPVWGEVLSIELTNIIISSFLVLIVFLLFRDMFSQKIALLASFFILLATPVSFYAITLKHHNLAVLFTLLSFYFFYKYYKKTDNRFIFLAYASAGLCVWTRILDGAALLGALLITDFIISRRNIKYLVTVSIVILISLMPFLIFNYLILGNPLSIIENVPPMTDQMTLYTAKDFIQLTENMNQQLQLGLFAKLGYDWNPVIKTDWMNIVLDITFLKLGNNFGIFLVSPFLIAAFGFVLEWVKRKTKLSGIDKLFAIYTVLFILLYLNYFILIVTDTPATLEYRYLLIFYVTLFYFSMRVGYLRMLVENNLKTICLMYAGMILLSLLYFIAGFPVPFMNQYYLVALGTSFFLIGLLILRAMLPNKIPRTIPVDKYMQFLIALSFALSSLFLIYYYWISTMSYIYPSQNYTIVPVLENIVRWMFQSIFSTKL